MTVDSLRAHFPLLVGEPTLHYLDSAATGQMCCAALQAVVAHETTARANVQRGTYALAEAADAAYQTARTAAARFVGGDTDEIVFTSGATASLNLVAHAFGAMLRPGDEVVVSRLEHHSNFVPWQQLRERRGVVLRTLPVTEDGRIDLSALERTLTQRCRLVAVTHCSNVTGAITDVVTIVAAAKALGARVLLDGAQAVQHGPVDTKSLGVDFYAFSGHKCFGPTGVGVLWGRRELLAVMPPFLTGGGMVGDVTEAETSFAAPPARFEAGTPPIAQAVGLAAALDWMATLPWNAIHAHERALAHRLIAGLKNIRDLRLIGPVDLEHRAPIVAFDIAGLHPHDICQVLDGQGVALRSGHHCARPLMHALGIDSASRASIALYNREEDIEALLGGLDMALKVLR